MSGLDSIGVRVEGNGFNFDDAAGGRAILNEITEMLSALVETGQSGSIDLQRIPLGDADYALLEEVLGEGEVAAEVSTLGPTVVIETGFSGVWWVTHHNEEAEVIAEFIEVDYCPQILRSPPDDVADGLDVLRAKLFEVRVPEHK